MSKQDWGETPSRQLPVQPWTVQVCPFPHSATVKDRGGGGDEADGGGGDGEADGGGGDGDGDGGGGEGGGDGEADGGGESRSTRVLQSAQSVPKAHELLSLFKPPSSQKPLLAVEHVSMHKVGGDGDGGIMSSSSLVWSSRRCEGIILLFAVSFSCASAPRTPQSEQSEPKAHAFDSAL